MSQKVKSAKTDTIDIFDLQPGRILAGKYDVLRLLGRGWQGEVYLIRERSTNIERAAKLFFPHRNPKDRTSTADAKKLHRLRDCSILIQYHTQEKIRFRKMDITCLVSEYVEGELLSEFLRKQTGKRIHYYEGLNLLYSLAKGIEEIHGLGEYHGDLHSDNIIVRRLGIGYEVKLLDIFHWWGAKRENIQEDVFDLIRVFYDAIGGRRWYAKHPRQIKAICCGLKRSLIAKKFKNAAQLRKYLETMTWE